MHALSTLLSPAQVRGQVCVCVGVGVVVVVVVVVGVVVGVVACVCWVGGGRLVGAAHTQGRAGGSGVAWRGVLHGRVSYHEATVLLLRPAGEACCCWPC